MAEEKRLIDTMNGSHFRGPRAIFEHADSLSPGAIEIYCVLCARAYNGIVKDLSTRDIIEGHKTDDNWPHS